MLLGRGDDCAVLGVSGPLCVSTDLFMEDVHFRRSYFTPEDIGWKALAVNLSDLAADGARPMGFTVGLSLPPDADMALVAVSYTHLRARPSTASPRSPTTARSRRWTTSS